jgi:hypothetical protein
VAATEIRSSILGSRGRASSATIKIYVWYHLETSPKVWKIQRKQARHRHQLKGTIDNPWNQWLTLCERCKTLKAAIPISSLIIIVKFYKNQMRQTVDPVWGLIKKTSKLALPHQNRKAKTKTPFKRFLR